MADARVLRLALAQTVCVTGDCAANAARIARIAHDCSADLLLTPELSLTGYDLRDRVHELAVDVETGAPVGGIGELADAPGRVIVGLPERARGGPFNSAVALQHGAVAFRHRKLYLPTYGMFDEGRWFGRGTALDVWRVGGWSIGVLICEDLWHPGLAWVLAARGIDVLLVPAAAPGRGVMAGGAHGAFASADVWERIVRTTAQLYGIYVALANRAGVEGAVTFAGGSLLAAPDGTVAARAPDRGEAVLQASLDRDALDAARRPYAHARDDDVNLVLRELLRGLPPPAPA